MIEVEPLPEGAALPGAGFLQSPFWSAFKGHFGWRSQAFRFVLREGPGQPAVEGRLRVLLRTLAGPLCFAYVPGGPVCDCPDGLRSRLLGDLATALKARLPLGCLFIRFDPPWYEEGRAEPDEEPASSPSAIAATVPAPAPFPSSAPATALIRPCFDKPLRKAKSDVQPPDSVLLDLRPTEGSILAAMKPKWRYNIRLAEKKDVRVEEAGVSGIEEFYGLYEETAERDHIAIHPRAYYATLFESCARAREALAREARPEGPDLRLWIARHEGRAIAAIITLYNYEEAVYLYGASSDGKRSLMPAYALQWAAIRAAKAAGCLRYDFYGIPPDADPGHPMAGLYRFKTGFGGKVVHYAGSWDLPLRPLAYLAWTGAEDLRAYWYKVARKRLFGRRRKG